MPETEAKEPGAKPNNPYVKVKGELDEAQTRVKKLEAENHKLEAALSKAHAANLDDEKTRLEDEVKDLTEKLKVADGQIQALSAPPEGESPVSEGNMVALPPLELTHHEHNPALVNHESGGTVWPQQWKYAERLAMHSDSTYNAETMFRRAQAVISRAFGKTSGADSFATDRMGPPDRSGQPNFSTLPPFKKEHKMCVMVWLEEAK